MMGSSLTNRPGFPRPMFDYAEVDAKETSRAWARFLSDRDAPSLPMRGVRSVIYQSWVRSNSTGIKPEQFAAPTLDSEPQSSKSRHDNSDMRRATQKSLTQIGAMLFGAEAILMLTDRDGVILDTVGDASTMDKANRINLRVGGIWSETASGTNGIGTALWAGQPVFVHGEEHFCEAMKSWSCAAAPIRDPLDQSIIGAINLSGLTSIFQKHNAAFAATAAREIEIALEREQSLLNMRLLEAIVGTIPMQTGNPGEGIAVVDRYGRMIFHRNCASAQQFQDKEMALRAGARFLDLHADLSEDSILAALPPDHGCQDIRLIKIDGAVKGAALVFTATPSRRAIPARQVALPGIVIPGGDLKIVGQSDAIKEALDAANRLAAANLPILIEGQTGVGKELFARLIHSRMSNGQKHPFAPVNCVAITQVLVDLALHPTSALTGRAPLILDELGELPAEIQPFLLHALEERGKAEGQALRIVSLTNRVMLDEVVAGRFRRDLFYRLGTMTLEIPPLKYRGEDILLIAEHYNRKFSADTGREVLILRSDVQEALMTHSWPGNVRELRNVISGLRFLAKDRTVLLTDLPREVIQRSVAPLPDMADPGPTPPTAPVALKDAESTLIRAALTAHHGNFSRAARVLGISRPTLYRKMQTYGITGIR